MMFPRVILLTDYLMRSYELRDGKAFMRHLRFGFFDLLIFIAIIQFPSPMNCNKLKLVTSLV